MIRHLLCFLRNTPSRVFVVWLSGDDGIQTSRAIVGYTLTLSVCLGCQRVKFR